MPVFYSSIPLGRNKVYQTVVEASCAHAEEKIGLHLTISSKDELLKYSLLKYSWRIALFLVYCAFSGKLFSDRVALIKYRGYSVGRYAVAFAHRSFESYLNKKAYWVELLRSLVRCCLLIESVRPYRNEIKAAYVEHGCYVNGVLYEVFSEEGIPIYHNNYPYNLVRWVGKGKQGFEASIKVYKRASNDGEISRGKDELHRVLHDVNILPYMCAEFEEKELIDHCFDYILYCHSFTDAQMENGYDGAFLNMLDWLDFTIGHLEGKSICIKAHPSFFAKGFLADVVAWDRRIFELVREKHANKPNVTIIDFAYKNASLLERVRPNTVLVSHHGNALLEGGALGFKCISSASAPWKDYNLFNSWKNREQYALLLSMDCASLKETNKQELYAFYARLHDSQCSYFSKNHWQNVVADLCGQSRSDFILDPSIFERANEKRISRARVLLKDLIVDCYE